MGKRSGSSKRLRSEQINVRATLDELMIMSENALDAGFDSIPAYLRYLGTQTSVKHK